MAARVCASCWLALPRAKTSCPHCGKPTAYDAALAEPEDYEWKARVEELASADEEEEHKLSEETRIRFNRTRRLMEAGLPYTLANELAIRRAEDGLGGFQVDVQRFDDLVDAGCEPATAARILG